MSFRFASLALTGAIAVAACAENAPTTPSAAVINVPTAAALAIDPAAACNGVTMPVGDCQVLVTLFNTTNGPAWTNKTGWGVSPNPCSWFGVVCTDFDHGPVLRVLLGDNGLAGPIPAALGNLASVENISIGFNALTGTVPATLANLPNLEILQVSNSQLSGAIPAALGNAPSLRILRLSKNALSGAIPAALGNATTLEVIDVQENALSGSIPAALGNLTEMLHLNLSSNNLTGTIPAALGNLTKLDVFAIQDNQITGEMPAALGAMSDLRVLYIHDNAMTGPVPNLTQWPKLDRTGLHGNQFTGQVPLAIASFGEQIEFGCTMVPGNAGLYVPDLPTYRAADLDGDGTICGLAFASAEDIGEDAVDDIDDLVPATLNGGQANALKTKIENAMAKADKGQFTAAINQMQSFLTQLSDMVSSGTLTPAQAAPFVAQANALIAIWTAQL